MSDISKVAVTSDETQYGIKDTWARQHMVKIDNEDQLIDGWKNFISGIKIGGATNGKQIKYTAAVVDTDNAENNRPEQIDFGEPVEIPAYTDLQTGDEYNDHNIEDIAALGDDSETFEDRVAETIPLTNWNFNGTLMVNGYPIASTNDVDPQKLVGKKYNDNIDYGEIVGDYSHNVAVHPQSFAAGYNTVSNNTAQTDPNRPTNQFVCGYYNDNQSDNIFEVGNGTPQARSNAFTVDKNGVVRCSGLFIGDLNVTKQFTENAISFYMPEYQESITTSTTLTTAVSMRDSQTIPCPILNDTRGLCICTLPFSLDKDGEVYIEVNCIKDNQIPNVYNDWNYFTKGKHIITFSFLLSEDSYGLDINIKTKYDSANRSTIRIVDAKVAAIETYINNLGSYTPTYDDAAPTITVDKDKAPRLYFFGAGWGHPLDWGITPNSGLTESLTE